MWDHLSFFLVACDVAQREASNHAVKLCASDITYAWGYVMASD